MSVFEGSPGEHGGYWTGQTSDGVSVSFVVRYGSIIGMGSGARPEQDRLDQVLCPPELGPPLGKVAADGSFTATREANTLCGRFVGRRRAEGTWEADGQTSRWTAEWEGYGDLVD